MCRPSALPTIGRMAVPDLPPGPQASEPVSWPVVLGLGALALLFPLAELTGASDAIGAVPMALLLLGLVAAVLIGGVGLLRVPRPVLTLTLAGAVSGVVLVGAFEVVRSTVLGTLAGLLAGLLAAAVQHTRSPRR
jgi:membrane associated rhomboid family serine protease